MQSLLETEPHLTGSHRITGAFEEILDVPPVAIVTTDAEGRIISWNAAAEKTFGYDAADILGKPTTVLMPERFRKRHTAGIARYHATGQPKALGRSHALIGLKRDGTTFPIQLTLERIVEAGETRFVAAIVDLTSRLNLHSMFNLQSRALDICANAIIITDRDGTILWTNHAIRPLTGYRPEELTGRTPAIFRSGHHNTTYYQALWETILSGRPWSGRVINRRKDGTTYVEHQTITPIADPEGTVTHFIAVKQDITREEQVAQTLARSEQDYRELFQNARVGMYRSTRDGRMTQVNNTLVTMLGYDSAEELMAIDMSEDLYARPGERERLIQTHSNDDFDGADGVETEWKRKDGQVITVRLTGRILRADDGTPTGYEMIVEDITERRELETQLALARKLESVGQLASGIAHEINTPMQYLGDNIHFLRSAADDILGLLTGYRELAKAAVSHQDLAQCVEALQAREDELDIPYIEENVPGAFDQSFQAVERVREIVLAMKGFSHPDQKEKTPFDLNDLVKNTLTVARNEYKYVADIETDLGDLPPVVGHAGAIGQVFLNLIVNAAHAIADKVHGTEERGRIAITTAVDGDDVRITIADTGCGIPSSLIERVFDPFFTTKEVGRGTGQGLAIARSAIEDHDGCLTVDSREGEGTTFCITLPIHGGTEDGEGQA